MLQRERAEEPEIWPDNLQAVSIFGGIASQWRVAVGLSSVVRTGLDYTAVKSYFELMRIPEEEWPEALYKVRIMEAAALRYWNK